MKKALYTATSIIAIAAVIAIACFLNGPSTAPRKNPEQPISADNSPVQAIFEEENRIEEKETVKEKNNENTAVTPPSEAKQAPNTASEDESGGEQTPKAHTCTLSVRCDTAVANISRLTPEKAEFVPKDGTIYSMREVAYNDGESVFNVLLREMKLNKIHFEFENTPIYKSAYVEGIANLYEFDCGELSGWMYRVNGVFPNYSCSKYIVSDGDVIEWIYTCDLGNDVGGRNVYTEE